jgi:adenine-specific DNA-methyltransferase
MDQVFAGMYQATFVWKRRSGSNDAKGAFVSTDHEYVVCYAGKGFAFGGEKKSFENYTNPDGDIEPWVRGDLTCNKNYVERPNTFYPIRNPMTDVWYACNPQRVWWCASNSRLKAGQKLRTEPMESLIAKKKVLFPVNDKTTTFHSCEALKAGITAGTAPSFLRADMYPTDAENDEYLTFFVGKILGFGSPGYKRHLSEVKKAVRPLSTWVVTSSEKDKPESDEVEFLSWGYTAEGTKLIQEMLGRKAFN